MLSPGCGSAKRQLLCLLPEEWLYRPFPCLGFTLPSVSTRAELGRAAGAVSDCTVSRDAGRWWDWEARTGM